MSTPEETAATEEVLAMVRSGTPSLIAIGLARWKYHGIRPGGFLTAVLENDLWRATGFADEDNVQNLRQIVNVAWDYLPFKALGSAERVRNWKGLDPQ